MECRAIILCLILIVNVSTEKDYLLSKQIIKQLDDWELNILRDFVRGRGRPIVERIPLDGLQEEGELIDLMNPSVPQGGMISKDAKPESATFLKPPQPVTQIITPASRRKPPKAVAIPSPIIEEKDEVNPSVEDYELLASMIQMFIDRRSSKNSNKLRAKSPAKKKLTTTTTIRPTIPRLPEEIITSSKENQNVVLDTLPKQSPTNKWSPMQRFAGNKDSSHEKQTPQNREKSEQRMKELSTELTKILKQLEESKQQRQPQIHVLRNGSAEQTSDGFYIFIATITLIKDGDQNILVDTGLGTNINARTDLIKSLEMKGCSPYDIDIVVSTHGHPDHNGGVHDFPDAIHYHSWYSHYKSKFNLTTLFENDTMNLSENVMLVKAKGHTSDDIAVVVRDVRGYGDVLVSGDLFMRGEDIDHPMMWQPLSSDVITQRDSRRRYGCIVDWIVPGHGFIFKVTNDVKDSLKC